MTVSRSGQMFAPKLLSIPPVPSICTLLGAPVKSVHTFAEAAVVHWASRLKPMVSQSVAVLSPKSTLVARMETARSMAAGGEEHERTVPVSSGGKLESTGSTQGGGGG